MGKQTNYSPTFPMFPAGAQAVSPSDSDNLDNPSVIYVGTAGDVKVTTANGDVATFTGVLGGAVLPVQVIRVWATGTTATDLVRIY
jgi:hypothetical protein